MIFKTFRKGGIEVPDNKMTKGRQIEPVQIPDIAVFPLSQHIGAPAVPCVQPGDKVLVGTLIAKGESFMSANIHSSICGTVKKIDKAPCLNGAYAPAIYIERDKEREEEWEPAIDRSETLADECSLSPQEIIGKIKDAGIVGLGGACFPTHVKMMPPKGAELDSLIVNGVECEPYLTADHSLMLAHSAEIIAGIRIMMKALGVSKSYIGIEANKPDAIALFRKELKSCKNIKVVPLKKKYPQGGEKQLIDAVLHRRVPNPPAIPANVGVVVENVATVYAIYQALQKNRPLIDRVVTVTGNSVAKPSNFISRLGISVNLLIENAGGIPEDTGKILHGGPMMGKPMRNLEIPMTKGTSGIVLLPETVSTRQPEQNCIRCAMCVEACPMGLEPYLLAQAAADSDWETAEKEGIMTCIECGCCQSTCPSFRPLLDWVRYSKNKVGGIIRQRNIKK